MSFNPIAHEQKYLRFRMKDILISYGITLGVFLDLNFSHASPKVKHTDWPAGHS